MLETSDGHGRLELMKFHTPPARVGDQYAPPSTLGVRRIAFAVDDIDAAVAGCKPPARSSLVGWSATFLSGEDLSRSDSDEHGDRRAQGIPKVPGTTAQARG
jgi:hypothetical protein